MGGDSKPRKMTLSRILLSGNQFCNDQIKLSASSLLNIKQNLLFLNLPIPVRSLSPAQGGCPIHWAVVSEAVVPVQIFQLSCYKRNQLQYPVP